MLVLNKLNRNVLMIVLGVIILGLLSGSFMFKTDNHSIQIGEIEYKLLNETYSSEELEKWVEENKTENGLYTKVIDGKTYIMYTYGEQTVDGYGFKGIHLDKTEDNGIVLSTELLEPAEDRTERSTYYPKIVLEVNQTLNETINFKVTKR